MCTREASNPRSSRTNAHPNTTSHTVARLKSIFHSTFVQADLMQSCPTVADGFADCLKKGLSNSIKVTQSYSHSDSLGSLTTDMPDSSKGSKQPTRFHRINRALHQSATPVCKKACPVCFPSTACFRQLPDFQHTKPHHTTFNTSLLLSQVAKSIWSV
jgi:hypothetical protein